MGDKNSLLLGIKYEAAMLGGMEGAPLARIEEQLHREVGENWRTDEDGPQRPQRHPSGARAAPRRGDQETDDAGEPGQAPAVAPGAWEVAVLYRDFATQEELDAQYDLRTRFPEAASLYEAFCGRESEGVRARISRTA